MAKTTWFGGLATKLSQAMSTVPLSILCSIASVTALSSELRM